jgi:hypothetical protein
MAPKIPSDKAIEAELAQAVRNIYNSSQRDQLSVNLVRQRVEDELDLEDGFFKSSDWKIKSKDIIKNALVCMAQCRH